jgi:hypothetical protein
MNSNVNFVTELFTSLEMAAVGYLIAVAIQMCLSFLYTRLSPNVLLAEDRWAPAYFGFAGVSWIVSAAIATYVTLPLATVLTRQDAYKASAVLVTVLVLLILRNRMQRPREQSLAVMLLFMVCIALGSTIASVLWATKHLS